MLPSIKLAFLLGTVLFLGLPSATSGKLLASSFDQGNLPHAYFGTALDLRTLPTGSR